MDHPGEAQRRRPPGREARRAAAGSTPRVHAGSILQSQGFYQGYAFILPTSLIYIALMPEASCLESLMRNRQYHGHRKAMTRNLPSLLPCYCMGILSPFHYCSSRFPPYSPRGGFQGRKSCGRACQRGENGIPEAPRKAVGNVRLHRSASSLEGKVLLFPFRHRRRGPEGPMNYPNSSELA